ncbi:MAG: hypothetical protein LBP26_04270 [Clostridiales bacterium]|jgi:hypothetical protein|nr:hypothetical protein [Clostridiales bacterium]
MTTFRLEYRKPRKLSFDVYYDGKRLKNKRRYSFRPDGVITLIEQNETAGRLRWLFFFIGILAAVLGSPEDWKDVRKVRKTVVIRFDGLTADTLRLVIGKNAEAYSLDGVKAYSVESETEEDCSAQVEKRVRFYKKTVVFAALGFLTCLAIAIIISVLLG